jgi:hypothetical protein
MNATKHSHNLLLEQLPYSVFMAATNRSKPADSDDDDRQEEDQDSQSDYRWYRHQNPPCACPRFYTLPFPAHFHRSTLHVEFITNHISIPEIGNLRQSELGFHPPTPLRLRFDHTPQSSCHQLYPVADGSTLKLK